MEIIDSKNIYEVLDIIRDYPERYLTKKSIDALQNFINGYLLANPYPDIEPPFWNFRHSTFFEDGGLNYFGNENFFKNFFLLKSNGDETLAFDLFFKYLDKYINNE